MHSTTVPCQNHQKRLSPVTGAAFPASVRAPISCQSLRLALTGSNSEALWQQLAQTSSRKPCNVPGHERFSAFFLAGNLLREVTGSGRVKEASIKMRNLISDVNDSPLSYYMHRKCIKVTLSMLFPEKSRPSSTRTHCEASVRRAALAIATKPHVQASKRRVGATGD